MSAIKRTRAHILSHLIIVSTVANLIELVSTIHLGWAQLQCTEERDPVQFFPHASDLEWMYLANFNTVLALDLFDRARREHVPPPLSYKETE